MIIKLVCITAISLALSACSSSSEQGTPSDSVTKQVRPSKSLLSGEQLFTACQACHSIEQGGQHKLGPKLWGIMGQAAGSQEGFQYSKALQNSQLVWTKATMVGWIAATETLVPGTWMTYHNHLSTKENLRLVDYIAEQK